MTKNNVKKCLLLCLAMLVGQTALAQIEGFSGRGTREDPYLIKSKADWDNVNAFRSTVSGGVVNRYWRLECDLVGDDAITKMHKYESVVFDGNGHTVELQIDGGTESVAMFYVNDINDGSISINNLHITGTIKGQGDYCATIVKDVKYVSLTNIHCEVTLESTGPGSYWGGLVGRTTTGGGYTHITNCAFVGAFKESANAPITKAGGLMGKSEVHIQFTNSYANISGSNIKDAKSLIYTYNYSSRTATVENTYYLNKYGDSYGTAVTEAQVQSGEICYLLGKDQTENPWRQRLGVEKDPHPLGPDRYIVNKYYDNFYANEMPEGTGDKDNPFQITHGSLWTFITFFQSIRTTDTYYVLCNNITLDRPEYILNSVKNVHIDGQGHTMTLNLNGEDVAGNVALFQNAENCSFRNMVITGTLKAKGTNSGVLIGNAKTPITLENISSDVTMEKVATGDTWGGFIGRASKGADSNELNITACSYIGKMLGQGVSWCGGFVGFAENSVKVCINGCYADITGSTVGSSRDIIRAFNNFSNVTFRNTFYVPFTGNEQPGAIKATKDSLASGAVGYLLNSGLDVAYWKQELGKDPIPLLNGQDAKYIVWKKGEKYYNRPYIVLNTPFDTEYKLTDKSQIYDVYSSKFYDKFMGAYVFNTERNNVGYVVFHSDNDKYCSNGILVNNHKEYDPLEEYAHSPYYIYLDKNILSRGHAYTEDGRTENISLSEFKINDENLLIADKTTQYEFIIMEGGKHLHHLLPARRGTDPGFYDAVRDTFLVQQGAELFLNQDECLHEYTKIEHRKEKEYTHCMLCDLCYDYKYFAMVKFEGNVSAMKSQNEEYNKVFGAMMYQDIAESDTLKQCLLRRPMHIFSGWNSQADGKGKAYADKGVFECSAQLCDTVHLYAQWIPAYRTSDGTLQPIPESGVVEHLDIVDNGQVGFAAAKDFKANNVSYTMVPKKGHQWGTICLPFEIEKQEGMKLYTTGAVKGGDIELSTEAETVPACTPAIYHLDEPANGDSITFEGTNKKVSETVIDNPVGELLLSGVLDYQNVKCDTATSIYYGIMYDKFYRVETSITLNPFRAYFHTPKTPAPLQVYNLLQTNDPTGIRGLNIEAEDSKDVIYDLSGRRLAAPRKGINIINGKKVVR